MATLRVRRRPWWKSSFKVASYADSYNWNKSGSYRYIWRKCRAFTAHQGNVWSLNPLDRDLSTSAHSWLLMLRKSYLTNFRDCRWPASNSLFCWVWLCEWYRWYYVAYMSTSWMTTYPACKVRFCALVKTRYWHRVLSHSPIDISWHNQDHHTINLRP